MPLALAILLAAAPSGPIDVPAPVRIALARALAVPGARLEVAAFSAALPAGCTPSDAEVLRPLAASGRTPLQVRGSASGGPCQGTAWATVRVFAPALVATRDLREGDPLAPASAPGERELTPGHAPLQALPDGAVAARAIAAGASLDPSHLRTGPRPGDPVSVLLRVGDVAVLQTGRALPCARGRACALLPSGRRVEGRYHPGQARILVEPP